MFNIILYNNDILQHILKLYIEHYNCKKNITNNNLSCCKQIYNLYKDFIVKYCKCNILYIEDINYKICSYHDDISLDFVKSLLEQIDIVNRIFQIIILLIMVKQMIAYLFMCLI